MKFSWITEAVECFIENTLAVILGIMFLITILIFGTIAILHGIQEGNVITSCGKQSVDYIISHRDECPKSLDYAYTQWKIDHKK